MAASPQIIPLTPPTKDDFFCLLANMSSAIQVIIAAAVARFVLMTAAEAAGPAQDGAPPLNPFQPSQSRPAPTATNGMLLGAPTPSRSRARRGPTIDAATNPETPAAR